MSAVSEDRLKSAVAECLSKFASLKDIKLKEVKRLVSVQLNLTLEEVNDYLAESIKTAVADYRKRQKLESEEDFVHGRFSKKDSAIVQQTITDYAANNSIDPTEISAFFREKENKNGSKFNDLWATLEELLPHRTKKAIQQHADRLLIRPLTDGSFSAEEKQKMKHLILTIGRDFQEIGKRLMKSPEDCRQMAIKLDGRKRTGKFTPEEDEAIIEKVRAVCCLPDVPVEELPLSGVAWTEVARLMDNERFPIDYNRRWPRIVNKYGPNVDITIPMLRYLQEKEVTDVSEVNWLHINKANFASPRAAQERWKLLQSLPELEGKSSLQERVAILLEKFKKSDFSVALVKGKEPTKRPRTSTSKTDNGDSSGEKKKRGRPKKSEATAVMVPPDHEKKKKQTEEEERELWGDESEAEEGDNGDSEVETEPEELGAGHEQSSDESEVVVPDTYIEVAKPVESSSSQSRKKNKKIEILSPEVESVKEGSSVAEEHENGKKKSKKHKKDRDAVTAAEVSHHSEKEKKEKKHKKNKKHKRDREHDPNAENDVSSEDKEAKKKKKHKKDSM